MQILIVDDDPVALQLLRFTLRKQGHDVWEAHDGADALEMLSAPRPQPIQVVISDWEMPGMDGPELCKHVRRMESRYTYMLLLTGRDRKSSMIRGFWAGADDFLNKPFDPEELHCRLRVAERILSLETRDVTIFALAKLAESRDHDTGAHLERVQNYCRLLAQNLLDTGAFPGQIDASLVNLMYETSPLHDIGKVAIPDYVLLKPGRLSDSEFEVMKTHTTLGAATLDAAMAKAPAARFLEVARDIALCHHERWDGTGYPRGLAGEAIPLCARIVSVADVYDALVSKRVYKSAMSHDMARTMILDGSGTQFDPQVVEAFLSVEREMANVSDRFSDTPRAAAA